MCSTAVSERLTRSVQALTTKAQSRVHARELAAKQAARAKRKGCLRVGIGCCVNNQNSYPDTPPHLKSTLYGYSVGGQRITRSRISYQLIRPHWGTRRSSFHFHVRGPYRVFQWWVRHSSGVLSSRIFGAASETTILTDARWLTFLLRRAPWNPLF